VHDPQAAPLRFSELGVVWPDSGRDDQRVGVAEMPDAAESVPDTVIPRASMIRAMPDMPAPPMPVK